MSDENSSTTEVRPVDPVAAARQIMAGQQASVTDDVAGLKKQIRALWITVGITLVLVVVIAAFTFLPRVFGVRMMGGGNFQGRPGNFQQNGQQQQSIPQQSNPQ